MKIQEIFDLAIQMGIDSDFRGKEGVVKVLNRKKKKYEALSPEAKEEFDQEALTNPYLDTRIYNIAEDKEIKKILVGIDIDTSELLLAKQLGDIDLVMGHHPIGRGLANLADIMEMQADVYNHYGVPINVAEGLNSPRISEVARGVSGSNHQKSVDAARILGINFMNVHTPADNLVARFLNNLVEKEKPERVEDLIDLLKEVPEYKEAIKIGVGPKAITGKPDSRCGKIAVTEITGGTEGSPKLFEKMSQAGIGTTLAMHASEEHRKEAENACINVVIAGHISSDSLGMNLFLDELEKKGIEIVCSSGLTRFKRF
ncbi:MAG TPA: NGG1p interacting factor NIF3 [Candidatus Pacearchaeota archaeon]|nr:NGG1p interacting factor NIF3 [Candidatus Pacearchaeota archaeon]HPR79816.1 NGG1p interacting factor NIF3 [Candidatus Pacearchaeota archaeon]